MKRIFFLVVFLEVVAIIFLLTRITSTKIVVSPLASEDYVLSRIADIQRFNEPKPKTILQNPTSWFPHPGLNTINTDTLNERYDYSIKKPEKTFRIITLGDSFTYGLYVNTQDNYPEQFENILSQKLHCKQWKKVEVINLGVGGYDAEYEYYRFLKRGMKYNPDLVIWFLKNDDFDQTKKEQDRYVESFKKVIAQNPTLREKYFAQRIYQPWTKMAKDVATKVLGANTIVDHQESMIKKLPNIYKGTLIFITFPFLNSNYKSFLVGLSKPKNIYFHETTNIYRYTNTSLADAHPNKNGYSLIANDLFSYLTKDNIVPCN